MTRTFDRVSEHLRVMDERIRVQRTVVDNLEQRHENASEAIRRLNLLLLALTEMKLHLSQLAETEMDEKNGRIDAAVMMRLFGKRAA